MASRYALKWNSFFDYAKEIGPRKWKLRSGPTHTSATRGRPCSLPPRTIATRGDPCSAPPFISLTVMCDCSYFCLPTDIFHVSTSFLQNNSHHWYRLFFQWNWCGGHRPIQLLMGHLEYSGSGHKLLHGDTAYRGTNRTAPIDRDWWHTTRTTYTRTILILIKCVDGNGFLSTSFDGTQVHANNDHKSLTRQITVVADNCSGKCLVFVI